MPYIREIGEKDGCFICEKLKASADDTDAMVLWRTDKSIVILNLFPYNNGHLLIAPIRHIAELDQADDEELLELTKLIIESQKALKLAVDPQGFNVGMNFGRCAGAGLPGHLHIHVVPRWQGDTNFMSICSDTKVVSQSLQELHGLLKDVSAKNNLPNLDT
jgi:ATP adenylyltransferase